MTHILYVNRKERTQGFLKDSETIELICVFVANGGSLVDLCRDRDIRYSDVARWLYADKARSVPYKEALAARGEWAIQRVISEIQKIGTVDIRKAYDEDGELLPVKEMPEEVARCVQSYHELRTKMGPQRTVKFCDKLKALEMLGKNLHMFNERVEHSGAVSLEDLVMSSFEKVANPKITVDTSEVVAGLPKDRPTFDAGGNGDTQAKE